MSVAWALLRSQPQRRIVIVDKESGCARHQSGRNSGVIHSGIYYRPGSRKTSLVAQGRRELLNFAARHGIAHELCGKVVVAVDETELAGLAALEQRARANGVATRRLDRAGLARREPHVSGLAALEVPDAGIVDFGAVVRALADQLAESGVELRYNAEVTAIETTPAALILTAGGCSLRAGSIVNCAGLHSDRVAALAGADLDGVAILPFRGEYRSLVGAARRLVRHLVYPVPDPDLPFLGVHLSRGIDGSVHAGPNAVLALHREGYRRRDLSLRDTAAIVAAPGTWRLARRHGRSGMTELRRSLSSRAFLRALQRLCPELRADDLGQAAAGVRAQAVDRRGRLLDDFAFADGSRSVHVINAPSPAATACFAIGTSVAERLARLT